MKTNLLLAILILSAPLFPLKAMPPTIQWTTSNVPGSTPFTGPINPQSVNPHATYMVRAMANDPDGNLATVSINKNGAPFAYAGGGNGWIMASNNATSDSNGVQVYSAWATDTNGERSSTIFLHVSVNRPPQISWSSSTGPGADAFVGPINPGRPLNIHDGQPFMIRAIGNDADGNLAKVSINMNGSPYAYAGGGDGSAYISNNATIGATGTLEFTAWAEDSMGLTSAPISMFVDIVPRQALIHYDIDHVKGYRASGHDHPLYAPFGNGYTQEFEHVFGWRPSYPVSRPLAVPYYTTQEHANDPSLLSYLQVNGFDPSPNLAKFPQTASDAHDPTWRSYDPIFYNPATGEGLYGSGDEDIIDQHAYWIRGLGVSGIIVDWTNYPSSLDVNLWPWEAAKANTHAVIQRYSELDSVLPNWAPKVVIAIRMYNKENIPNNPQWATRSADEIHDLYLQYPNQFFRVNDGTPGSDKPLLIVFVDFFESASWADAPQWTDSRFNVRYTNGFLSATGLAEPTGTGAQYDVIDNLPYWNFIEPYPNPSQPGYYRAVYRNSIIGATEQTALWVGLAGPELGGNGWHGMLSPVFGGKRTIERIGSTILQRPPRITWLSRFNYGVIRPAAPGEGISENDSTVIEPSRENRFVIYNMTSNVMREVLNQPKLPPTAPVVVASSAQTVSVTGGNWPTEVQINNGDWVPYRVNAFLGAGPTMSIQWTTRPITIRFRNAFGVGPAISW